MNRCKKCRTRLSIGNYCINCRLTMAIEEGLTTRSEVANHCDVTKSTVGRWVGGIHTPNGHNGYMVAKLLRTVEANRE